MEGYLGTVTYQAYDENDNLIDQCRFMFLTSWDEAVEKGMLYATETEGATGFTLSMGYGQHPCWEMFEKVCDCWKSVGSENLDELRDQC